MRNLQDNLMKDYKMQHVIDNTRRTKPYVDSTTGTVFWGTDSEAHKKEKE